MAGGRRSIIACPFPAGLIGAGAGLLAGGRAIKTYDWRTEWFVPAPLPAVYDAMTSRRALRQWWPSMELVDDGEKDELQAGSSVSFRVHQALKQKGPVTVPRARMSRSAGTYASPTRSSTSWATSPSVSTATATTAL